MQIGYLRTLTQTAAVLVALAMACATAHADDTWFELDSNELFTGWRTQVQELVDQVPNTAPTRICVVGVTDGDPFSLEAFVIWPGHHQLIIWIPSKTDSHSLGHQTRVLDLETDVVASEKQVAGSTYLVTRAWLRGIERRCNTQGTTLTLTPRKGR